MSGSFAALIQPASGLAAGTRFDTVYGANAVSLVVTPRFYAGLAAAGMAESRSESDVGHALDAIRPPPGTALDPAQAALFDPLYRLPAGSIAPGLDELAPSIYPDAMITARSAWYLMANAVGAQLAARRGLAADSAASTVPGPNGRTTWVSGLGGYNSIGANSGSSGFTAGLGGMAAGIDVPVDGTVRLGVAIGTVDGQTWSQSGGNCDQPHGAACRLWRVAQRHVLRRRPTRHDLSTGERASGAASVRQRPRGAAPTGWPVAAVRGSACSRTIGGWLIEPSLGFDLFALHQNSLSETGGALAESIGDATLRSAQATLAAGAQRRFALSETVTMTLSGRLGWTHEFADNTARVAARFAELSGSEFVESSTPIGRDAALVGLGTDIAVASWPVTMFVAYGGAINASSSAQSVNVGVRFEW